MGQAESDKGAIEGIGRGIFGDLVRRGSLMRDVSFAVVDEASGELRLSFDVMAEASVEAVERAGAGLA